jgi:AcrR family transcriptional regulator
MPATVKPTRRTQAERRSATRAKLLDAVLEELVASGYGSLTTPAVCRRAGVSQGALFKHFPTKAALVAAAVEFLFAALVADYGRRFGEAAGPGDPLRRGVLLLWEVFQDPRLIAAYDLYAAARTDAELRASLEPVVRRHVDALHALAAALFAPADEDERSRLVAVVDLAILAMQGLVVNELATGGERRREELPPLLVEVASLLLRGKETRR